jgi:hypothetical protein
MYLVNSCTTNSILRETKYFQTLTRSFKNVLTIARRDATIVGSGRATITFPNDTQIMIEDTLLYPNSTHTLISFRVSKRADYMYVPMKTTKRSFSLLLSHPDMAMKF